MCTSTYLTEMPNHHQTGVINISVHPNGNYDRTLSAKQRPRVLLLRHHKSLHRTNQSHYDLTGPNDLCFSEN